MGILFGSSQESYVRLTIEEGTAERVAHAWLDSQPDEVREAYDAEFAEFEFADIGDAAERWRLADPERSAGRAQGDQELLQMTNCRT